MLKNKNKKMLLDKKVTYNFHGVSAVLMVLLPQQDKVRINHFP